MQATAVVFEQPGRLSLRSLELSAPAPADVVVEIDQSGISTGTERLLWSGTMPKFPGLGYPLVPGYEAVGRVVAAGPQSGRDIGDRVFVPGASCYGEVRGLFGGASSRVVVPGARTLRTFLGEEAILLALAATAYHAIGTPAAIPDLIVGHGVLGRLLARIALALNAPAPVVWECNPNRQDGTLGYAVVHPEMDSRRDYACICDASGDASILDSLIERLRPGGEIVLAGFYSGSLSFRFPPAFMREARLRVAAQWKPSDLQAVHDLVCAGRLRLDGLVTHREPASAAASAYHTAFEDDHCLKMALDWRTTR